MPWKEVGKRISELRQDNNLTQAQFAELIGISRDSLGKIERGIKSPGDLVPIICKKIGASSDYIYFGKTDPLGDIAFLCDYDPVELSILLDCLKRLTGTLDTANGNDLIMKEIMRRRSVPVKV